MTSPDYAAAALEAVGVTVATFAAIGAAAVLAAVASPRAHANRAKLAARRRQARHARRTAGAIPELAAFPFRATPARALTPLEARHAAEAARLRRLEADGIIRVVDVLKEA